MKTAYFMDFEFETEDSTLFPRFETELLVEKAVRLITKKGPAGGVYRILDIGTGCGNVAISLTKYLPASKIVASDISDTALRVASKNAAKYGAWGRIEFIKSDLFENIKPGSEHVFDLVISNPPYVALGDFSTLPVEVKDDPHIALYGGKDGMEFYRRIAERAPAYLKDRGLLLLEMGQGQSWAIKGILESTGKYGNVEIDKDYAGIDRIIKAETSVTHIIGQV